MAPGLIRHRSRGPRALAAAAAAALTLPAAAGAADPHASLTSDPGLKLGQVVRAAAERFPERARPAARRAEAGALDRRASAWLPGNPAVELTHYNDAVGTGAGNREWEAGLDLPLWRPGQKAARAAVAEGAAAQAEAGRRALRLKAAGAVREALWALALQRNRVALARTELETARSLRDKVKRRLELGDLARTDLLMARERVGEKRTALTEARSRLRVLRSRYRRLTGLERVPDGWREERADAAPALADHPAVARAARAVQRLRAQRDLAGKESAANPSLLLGSRRERAADGTTVNSLLASVRVPFGLSTQRRAAEAAAGVDLAAARARLDRVRRQTRQALDRARESIAAARQTLDQARERERMARDSRDLARKAFDAGEYDLIDLIKVQEKYAGARRDRARRELTLQRAVARYNQAAGDIPWPHSASSH
ncbi:MAG TPA: TolC family protein [Gammaproteobacteria bacterium]|nr:TolC family protein [Gammaproteobacteria bacterium]